MTVTPSSAERVQVRDPCAADVLLVARHQRQSVHLRRRGEQSVDGGERRRDVQPTPLLGDALVDRQDAVAMIAQDPTQPSVEAGGGASEAVALQNRPQRPTAGMAARR